MQTSGVVNVFKEKGKSSRYYTNKVKHLSKMKTGHIGTLDPMAFGVLPIVVGEATKFIDFLDFDKKAYIYRIIFGKTTETLDAEGEFTDEEAWDFEKSDLLRVLDEIEGAYEQVPPKYSAKKINGVPMYKLARENIDIDTASRAKTVQIYKNRLLKFNKEKFYAIVMSDVSTGTYIRTLAFDIAQKLGTISYIDYLMRYYSGPLKIDEAICIDDMEEDDLIPVDTLIDLPVLKLNEKRFKAVQNGMNSYVNDAYNEEYYKVYCADKFCGVGYVKKDESGRKNIYMKKVYKYEDN